MEFTIADMELDEQGHLAAAAKRRVENWIEEEVQRRTHAIEYDVMLVIGMLAARHPDGITFSMTEYDTARRGRLIREPNTDPRYVRFRFVPEPQ